MNIQFEKNRLLSEFNGRRPNQVTIPNEDIIQEYIQAEVVGRGTDYKEYVNESDNVSNKTKETVNTLDENFDGENYETLDEVERKLNKTIRKIYDQSRMEKAIKKMEKQARKQIRNAKNSSKKLRNEFGKTDVVIDTIDKLERLLKLFGSVLTFGGVAISMLLSVAGRSFAGAGLIMLCFAPIILLGTAAHGGIETGLIYTAVSATAAIAGGASWKAFDSLAHEIDRIYMEEIK